MKRRLRIIPVLILMIITVLIAAKICLIFLELGLYEIKNLFAGKATFFQLINALWKLPFIGVIWYFTKKILLQEAQLLTNNKKTKTYNKR